MRRPSAAQRKRERKAEREPDLLDQMEELMRGSEVAAKARHMLSAARHRAKKKNLPYALTRTDSLSVQAVLQRGRCELTGLSFSPGPFAASLDRIEPAKGYVSGNVRVVCRLMNAALGNWGEDVLRKVMVEWLPKEAKRPPYNIESSPLSLFD